MSIKVLVEKHNYFQWSLRIQRWIRSPYAVLGVQSERRIQQGSEIAFSLGYLGTVSDGPSECFFSNRKIIPSLLTLNGLLFLWHVGSPGEHLPSVPQCGQSWGCVLLCHSNAMFLSTFPSSYSNRKITRDFFFFCSSVEDACKCSITAPTMQLWWHVMALFPNSVSHNKRSSNHSDRHNDRLPFYLTCNLPRKLRQKLLSIFVKHRVRGVCTKPIKKRIAFCGFFPGALFWKLTSIY